MLIAVDGGASRCRAAAFDRHGVRTGTVLIEAHASLSLGAEAAAGTVRRAIEACARALDRPAGWMPERLALGLAGSLGQERRAAFIERLSAPGEVQLITDGQAQLLGASGGRAGVCVAVGTGSVVHWQDRQGRFGMGGGWGFPVGDEGSAAWLGVQALHAWTAALDGAGAGAGASDGVGDGDGSGSLFNALRERVGDDIGAIQRWTTCTVSSELGRLAPLVAQAAAAGDPVAVDVLARGAQACHALFELAPPDLPRWLTGGLCELYRPALTASGIELEPVAGDALDGLHRYALQNDCALAQKADPDSAQEAAT